MVGRLRSQRLSPFDELKRKGRLVFPAGPEHSESAPVMVREPVAELQHLSTQEDANDFLAVPFSSEAVRMLMSEEPNGPVPERHLNVLQLVGIVDAVRNKVLGIAPELEAKRVLGDGLSFSSNEAERASAINVQLFTGAVTMRDNYVAGQTGAVGPNSNSRSTQFG